MNSNLYKVILGPHVSERSATIAENNNQYVFKVDVKATKNDVKAAIEGIFDVEVVKVNTILQKGKSKTFRGRVGKRSNFKKAIVTLAKGQEIDFVGGDVGA